MHFCGIIIKPTNISITKARTLLGDELVNRGVADWYSADRHRERTFKKRRKIPLSEFKELFTGKEFLGSLKSDADHTYFGNNSWVFAVIRNDCIDELFLAEEFWEFYNYPSHRRKLISAYIDAYKEATTDVINKLLESPTQEYDVTLLDYHN